MIKRKLLILLFLLLAAILPVFSCFAKLIPGNAGYRNVVVKAMKVDTVPPADVMRVVTAVIYSLNSFNIDAVANLYTPNAVIADDEPPYSWNGPTAGVQWVNAVEQVCKANHLTKLKAKIESINVFQQTAENVYIVVPVGFTGNLPDRGRFTVVGAFTFVLRMINGQWLIKSQAWMPKTGM